MQCVVSGLIAGLVLLSGCAGANTAVKAAAPATPATPAPSAPTSSAPPPPTTTPAVLGSVFTMNNSATANAVLSFSRQAGGSLVLAGTYPTGGIGTGGGLENQGALALSTDGKFLYVVNAGSNDFSVFAIGATVLTLTSRVASGGAHPISVTEHDGVVYVLSLDSVSGASGFDSISGFRVDANGNATAIANSRRALSMPSAVAAQVAFSPDGSLLLVTERGTATIDAFTVDGNGNPSATAVLNASVGGAPFGFQFLDDTHVLISEEGPDAVSSYTVSATGALTPISRSVPTFQAAVCWLAISPNLQFAFTGNTSGRSVSGFGVSSSASVSLLTPGGLSAATDGGALDVTVSSDGQYLYSVLTGGTLETFAIGANGALTKVQSLASLGAINGVVSF